MEIKNSSPCKGCEDRVPGCHSTCHEKYIPWKETHLEKKRAIRGDQKREQMLNDFTADGYRRVAKRIGRKV